MHKTRQLRGFVLGLCARLGDTNPCPKRAINKPMRASCASLVVENKFGLGHVAQDCKLSPL